MVKVMGVFFLPLRERAENGLKSKNVGVVFKQVTVCSKALPEKLIVAQLFQIIFRLVWSQTPHCRKKINHFHF